jgi:SAM-dependent methyltransferase
VTDDFDLKHGTDTSGDIPLWNFTIDSPNARFGVRYQPSDEQELAAAISFLPEDPRNLTFIDLGCGKGRALLVAAQLGFKQVIGVEFARELVDIARNNLVNLRIANAVVVESDASEYRFPGGDMVVYLYNPFSEEIVRKVIANLSKFASKKLYVIYTASEYPALFDQSGFLTRLGSPPERDYIQIWSATDRESHSSC